MERIFTYHFLEKEGREEEVKNLPEYEISRRFFDKLSRRLTLNIVETEVSDFAVYLKLGNKKNYFEKEQMEEFVSDLVEHIIIEIKEHFDIDFSDDKEFRLGLELHMVSLLKRHYEHVEIDNTCLEEVKRKYPLIFEMGVWVCKIMEDYLQITISENEISFIALHIGSAYERANLRRKYRGILICPHNRTVKELCVQKIMNRFDDRIEMIDCMSYFEESAILEKRPDFILATQSVVHSLDIITVMCDRLYARGYVKKDFKEGVLKRESLSPTSFFHGFAIPHNMSHKATVHSAISTAILKRPVKWGNYEVRFVFLLAITEENRNFLKIFFDWLDDVVSDSEKFARLVEVQDYQSFVDTLL